MEKEKFNLTEDHIKLIRRMNVSYNDHCEFGAPEINPKRPYGNSYVYGDIGEILGMEPTEGDPDDPYFTAEQEAFMLKMHKETDKALQVILSSGSFSAGWYESEKYHDKWEAVE
jgi:hypothetical protein